MGELGRSLNMLCHCSPIGRDNSLRSYAVRVRISSVTFIKKLLTSIGKYVIIIL